jgi:hypothetical protein
MAIGGVMADLTKKVPESQIVTWVFEEDADGNWALFLRAGGSHVRVSPRFPNRPALLAQVENALTKALGDLSE